MYISNFSIEEFGKTTNEPYIKTRSDTNFINHFMTSPEDKSEVTVLVVNSLYSCKSSHFVSVSHLSWAMEFLGYAFSLSMKNQKVISKAFKIYSSWLLGKDIPSIIVQNEDYYLQEIIGHMSLLFTEREGLIEAHSKLCKKVLIFLKNLTEQKNLSKSSWQCLLKVLLLISSLTLTNMKALSQQISPFLLTVLFELWIKSNTRDSILWQELESNSALWLDHIWFVNQWQSVVIQLTRKVVDFIYGEFDPKSIFRSSVLEESKLLKPGESLILEVDIQSETVLFLWHKFLWLMMNDTKARVPSDCKVHKELCESIDKIIDIFLEICDNRNSRYFTITTISDSCEILQPLIRDLNRLNFEYENKKSRLPIPSGNSLLYIFGEWLFYHAEVQESYSEFGNGPAVGTLCKIICKAQGPVSEEYLRKFFKILQNNFTSNFNQLTAGYVIKNSQNLFCLNNIELKHFAFSENFLNCLKKIVTDPDNSALKKHCCGIISSIIGMNPLLGWGVSSKIFKEIFMVVLKQENEQEIFKKVIWSMATFAATEKEEVSIEIADALVSKLQDMNYITQRINNNMLIECVSSLPYIVDNLSNSMMLIDKLCSYLKKVQTKNIYDTHSLLILCIFNWWVCYPKNFDIKDLQEDVFLVLDSEFSNKSVKEAAEFVKDYIKQALLQSFSYCYTKITCDIINTKNTFNLIKHFLFKNQYILSIYNSSISENIKDMIMCILRNNTGKYVWGTSIEYPIEIEKNIKLNIEICENLVTDQEAYEENIDIPDDESYDKYTKIFESQEQFVQNFQSQFNEKYGEGLKAVDQKIDQNKSYRLFLSQLGLYNDSELKELIAIDNDITSSISSLDEIDEKKIIFIPIFFLDNAHSKVNASGQFSQEYIELLNNIGVVLTEDHRHIEIFSKINSYIQKYKVIIYTSDALSEILFLPIGISKITKKEALELSDIFIIWNERNDDKYSMKIPDILEKKEFIKNKILLLIPDSSQSVRIKKFGGDFHGPLIDDMNISFSLIPKLLIRTALNSNLSLTLKVEAKKKRAQIIKGISEKLKNENELVRKQKVLTRSFLP